MASLPDGRGLQGLKDVAVEQPYLSIVVTARNDDHGGNLLGRMQAFINGWVAQSKRHRLTSELIIVEWNPPLERPRLADALDWPKDLGPCQVRIIQVPPELHRRYAHSEALPLYQMIAKNVGIRRACGQFVLATNIDIIFSNELAGFLAKRLLERRCMYRIDRHDVMSEVPIDGIDEQLAYCETHLIRVNAREGTFSLTPQGLRELSPNDVAAPDSGIMFGPGWFPLEYGLPGETFRWATTEAEFQAAPPSPNVRCLKLEIEPGPGVGTAPLEILFANASGTQIVRATVHSRGVLRVPLKAVTAGGPFVVRSRVLNGGRSNPLDPRILEFRVFRCDWDSETEERPKDHFFIEVGAAPRGPLLLWSRFQRFLAMLAYGGDVVPVPMAISPKVRRALRIYVHNGGITGLLRAGFKSGTQLSTPSATPIGAETTLSKIPVTPQQTHLHTNGCGDFTLMSQEDWLDLRGYPEFDMFSMHLDSLFCLSAHFGGVVEKVLEEPMRIYHIEHGTGSGWTPEGQGKLFARIAASGLSMFENQEVIGLAAQMRKLRCPMIFNLTNWGLADFNLSETKATGAGL